MEKERIIRYRTNKRNERKIRRYAKRGYTL